MKRIVILGGGESGVGAAVLAKKENFDVFLSDFGKIKPEYKSVLDKHGIEWEEGRHTEAKILSADEVIKSPGIPESAPVIQKLKAQGVHIISEIEFAGRYAGNAKMICITGSNGKTTTTMLTYHILKDAGLNVGLAGNVGKSLALQVAESPRDCYVIELSSFQLDNMYDFKADIAIMLNITPDHLDRYEYKFQNYVNSKFRIVQNQTVDDVFIYWSNDPVIREELRHRDIPSHKYAFGEQNADGATARLEGGTIVIDTLKKHFEMLENDLSLKGTHNLYNSMAAGISACVMDIRNEKIRESLSNFEGVEHRLEYVATVRGVRFINDSKATNVNSCWYALQSMTAKTVLILGGKDKGNDYSEIEELVRQKVRAIVCMGKDNRKIIDFFTGKVEKIIDTHSVEEAVSQAYNAAQKGDCVLLSPCCASFDLFSSYEDRGRQFKNCVLKL